MLFDWTIARNIYGLEHSPTDRLKTVRIIGKRKTRERVLNDDEIRKVWAAAEAEGYPFGPALRLLLLSGCRLSEIAKAEWREIDPVRRVLTIPAQRYKVNQQHVVALSDMAWEIVEGLPRYVNGDFLFSVTGGVSPVCGWYLPKRRLDAASGVRGWQIHDLRRTYRTRLAELRVPDTVAELALGHARKGIAGVYDRHRYVDEIRAANEAWADRLRSILAGPSNIVRAKFRA